MRLHLRSLTALIIIIVGGCKGAGTTDRDNPQGPPPADSPAPASSNPGSKSAESPGSPAQPGSPEGLAKGKEPGTIPATPTPSVTSDNLIAAMRQNLQRLESASAQELSGKMPEHQKMLGDLLTTMRVEVQAATANSRNAWLASADSAESDLDRLALARGDALTTAFREHRSRVLRLLDGFRVLVPAKSF